MANTQAQFGFRHIGYLGGGAPDYQLSTYTIASTYATAIGFGDPVLLTTTGATGTLIQATNALATTVPIVGIFQGCEYPSTGGTVVWSPFWPGSGASANATAYVIDAPNAKFLAAAFSTAVSSTQIGYTVNFTGGAANTTGGGFSIATIDAVNATSLATSGTTVTSFPFRILGLYPGVGNGSDPTTNFNWAVVGFNFQINRPY